MSPLSWPILGAPNGHWASPMIIGHPLWSLGIPYDHWPSSMIIGHPLWSLAILYDNWHRLWKLDIAYENWIPPIDNRASPMKISNPLWSLGMPHDRSYLRYAIVEIEKTCIRNLELWSSNCPICFIIRAHSFVMSKGDFCSVWRIFHIFTSRSFFQTRATQRNVSFDFWCSWSLTWLWSLVSCPFIPARFETL